MGEFLEARRKLDRSKNFSSADNKMLLSTIEPFLQVIQGKGIDRSVKEKAWIEIARRFNETTICEKRTVQILQNKYKNYKSFIRRSAREIRKKNSDTSDTEDEGQSIKSSTPATPADWMDYFDDMNTPHPLKTEYPDHDQPTITSDDPLTEAFSTQAPKRPKVVVQQTSNKKSSASSRGLSLQDKLLLRQITLAEREIEFVEKKTAFLQHKMDHCGSCSCSSMPLKEF